MNLDINYPFFHFKNELTKITNRLNSSLSVRFVDYCRYYYTGKFIVLSKEIEFDVKAFGNDHVPTLEELQINRSRYIIFSGSIFKPEFLVNSSMYENNLKFSAEFDLHHRIFLIYNYSTYVETFEIGIDNAKKNPIEFFLNNLSILEKFCKYFRLEAAPLIDEVNKYQIVFCNNELLNHFSEIVLDQKKLYEILLEEKANKHKVKGKNGTFMLSSREFECLIHIATNNTAKKIGQLMGLSYRTVEDYILHLKDKLGCRSKQELVDVARNNSIITACFL